MFGKRWATFYIVHPNGEVACRFQAKISQIPPQGTLIKIPWPDGHGYNFDKHGLSYSGKEMSVNKSVLAVGLDELKVYLDSGLTPENIEALKVEEKNKHSGHHKDYRDTFCEGGAW